MVTLRRIALSIALIRLAGPGTAHADGLDGERFVPSVGAEGTFVDEHPAVASHLGWSAGLFLNFADDQVVLRDAAGNVASRPLHTGLTTDLTASLGLFGWAEIGIGLPLHLVYDGDVYAAGTARLDASPGVGDLRLVPKFALLRRGTLSRHVLLGIAVPVSVPTGDDEAARGAGGVGVQPELLFAFHDGRLGLGFDAGYRYRSHHPADLPWGDEITLDPWLSVGLTRALTLRIEGFAEKEVNASVSGADFPFEVLAGIDYAIGNWDLYAAASRGITDGIGDPAIRIIGGVRYRQNAGHHEGFEDSDHDGIPDKDDRCPGEPEDEDGFEDADGCPDPDNDEDGIPDAQDECPELKGDRAHDGCPATTYVKIENGKVFIFGKVQFSTNSARIDRRSEPLLDQIAQALNANPGIGSIVIEGHTDNVGDTRFNQRLSEERAVAVREALIHRGVDGDRLRPHGFGETRPLAPNKSPAGRAKNRRVDFVIQGGRR
ncbi:MAG TPA: OmpA family protein [Kofleriaceae bacterium]|jgi:outer membrane protein OmpA-like peptidoglycan-associated protein|nr:OmpA family protein [Kofleriaceae bacterium]